MKYLNWKIGSALVTFLIGTILTFVWFASKPKSIKSLDVSEQLTTSTDPDYLKGRTEAERDVKAGELVIIVEGQTRFEVLLRDELSKYGVQIRSIGCFFKKQDEKHWKGYNQVSKAAIDARFGRDVAEDAIRKAAEQDFDATPR